MVTQDEIRFAYLFLLGREPEDEAYVHHSGHENVPALRQALLQSKEGQLRLRADVRETREEDSFQYFRPLLVFIHIEKVGGSSLYDRLYEQFDPGCASPPHLNGIPDYTMTELNEYDFISGHFSYQEAMALPRSPKTSLIVFREPFARLLSFYRFHRAHPDSLRDDWTIDLAKRLEPADFFRHPLMRISPRINNAYLKCLADYPGKDGLTDRRKIEEKLELAYERLNTITALGLTENMADSVRLINAATGFSIPNRINMINTTADLHKREGFLPAEIIRMSPEIHEALFPLVEHDLKIYARARQLFASRLAVLGGTSAGSVSPSHRGRRPASVITPLSVLRKTAEHARSIVFAQR